jgi:hypothetical protein
MNPLLHHGVAITNGDRIIFQCLIIDGNAEGSADFILIEVTFPNIPAIVPSGAHLLAEHMEHPRAFPTISGLFFTSGKTAAL